MNLIKEIKGKGKSSKSVPVGEKAEGGTGDDVVFLYHMDSPLTRRITSVGEECTLHVSGWAGLTNEKSVDFSIEFDGQILSKGRADLLRADVRDFFLKEDITMPANCGFNVGLRLTNISPDGGVLKLKFFDDNRKYEIISIDVGRFSSIRYLSKASIDGDYAYSVYPETLAVFGSDSFGRVLPADHPQRSQIESRAQSTFEALRDTVGITKNDVVLEVGCGAGWVGRLLSPVCRTWIGCEFSETVLHNVRENLRGIGNIQLVSLERQDLAPIPDAFVDVVYISGKLARLSEWDRFNFVCEAKRVLKPNGRIFLENVNLLGDPGWSLFMKNLLEFDPSDRPEQMQKSSTPSELLTYLKRAGFIGSRVRRSSDRFLLQAWGTKAAENVRGGKAKR